MGSTVLPLAHLGHWYVGGPVFLTPVVLVWVLMKLGDWRDRRRGAVTESSRVEVDRTGAAPRLAVHGALDWPALLDLEEELAALREAGPRLEVDLRKVTELDRRGAERLADLVGEPGGPQIVVVPGSADAAAVLRGAGAPVA